MYVYIYILLALLSLLLYLLLLSSLLLYLLLLSSLSLYVCIYVYITIFYLTISIYIPLYPIISNYIPLYHQVAKNNLPLLQTFSHFHRLPEGKKHPNFILDEGSALNGRQNETQNGHFIQRLRHLPGWLPHPRRDW